MVNVNDDLERIHQLGGTANIYIEGDGVEWMDKTGNTVENPELRKKTGTEWFAEKSEAIDPTPKNPIALHLSTKDRAKNVIYLARPCQFARDPRHNPGCSSAYWADRRFSQDVINAYHDALDEIRGRYDIKSFNIVGFSGGGAIAALLSAQRSDIDTLRTVSGNLDHITWSKYHHGEFLNDSLNPVDYASKLSHVPQYHFIGGQDKTVPPAVLHSYIQAMGNSPCVN